MNEILFRPVGLEVHVVVGVCRAGVLGVLARVYPGSSKGPIMKRVPYYIGGLKGTLKRGSNLE